MPPPLPMIAYACIGILLLCGAYTDHKSRTIPNWIPLSILLFGLFTDIAWSIKFISLGIIVAVLILVTVLSKSKSGGGDIKLYCAMCFSLGLLLTAVCLFVTVILTLLWQMVILRRRPDRKRRVPLCSFVAPAYIILLVVSLLAAIF